MKLILQYLNALYKYSKKIERTKGGNFYMIALRGAFTMHPEFCFGKGSSAKLNQIKRTLFKSKLNFASEDIFFYELDENRIMLHSNTVIDNMPVDYSIIIDSSIDELLYRNAKYDNAVSKQNTDYLNLLNTYIDRTCAKISNNSVAEAILSFKTRPAENLYEALQRILFYHQIIAQTGHTLNGLGRLDKYLSRFESGENDELFIKSFLKSLHNFYNFNSNDLLGDTGQIIILGGIEEDESYYSNYWTSLIIKCLMELRLPDPKVLLRVSASMPDELYSLASDCISVGIGSPLLSNDDVIIPTLHDLGYSPHDAHNYGVSACWEPLSIGNSLEQNNMDCIEYAAVLSSIMQSPNFINCKSMEEVFALYIKNLKSHLDSILAKINSVVFERDPVLTLLTANCLENGKDISEGGALYNNYGILSVGLSSVVNSLININRYVFTEKLFSLDDIAVVISTDYADKLPMEKVFSMNCSGFGTDNPEALELTKRIVSETEDFICRYRNTFNGKVKFGLSSPTYIRSGSACGATADGRKSAQPLATHISRGGNNSITELPRFAANLEYSGFSTNGNVVDIMLQPTLVNAENKESFCNYLKSCIEMGVYQMQFNVVSLKELLDAKLHPELHKDLIVRVWGFSAYFNDLPEDYQDALIQRAKEMENVS